MKLARRDHQPLQIHRAGKNKLDTFTGKLAIFTVDIENPLSHLQGICCWISIREIALICCGQLKLATALEFFQYRFSDSFGGNPPLYSCGLSAL